MTDERPKRPAAGLREAKKRANRDAILAAGRRVFAEIGLEAATARDVIRESGLAQGSFYNYFDSKEAVFEVIVTEIAGAVHALLQSRLDAVPPDQAPRGLLSAQYRLALEMTALSPEIAELMRRNQSAFRERFYQGPAHGALVADLAADLSRRMESGALLAHDPRELAEVMLSLGVDLIVLCLQSREAAEKRVEFLEEMFARAYLPNEGNAS